MSALKKEIKMKILHVTPGFYPYKGGIEKFVEGLCLNLNKMGHTSDVLTPNSRAYTKEKLPGYGEHRGIRIFRIPCIDFNFYYLAPSVLNFIKKYDVIHIHGIGFFSDFLTLIKPIHHKPLILSTHGGIFHTKRFGIFKKIYFNFWCRLILRKIDKIISDSKQDQKLFSKIVKPILVPVAVDCEKILKIRRKPHKNTLLYIGRISKNKRIDRLIEVVYFLKKKIPDIKLHIIGNDWQGIRKDLENLAKEKKVEKNVIFEGIVSEEKKINHLSRSQFFVCASEYEGFGISVVEAMGAGCPVIINNIEAFRNFVENGKNGFLVDFSKPEIVADAVLNLMNKDLSGVQKNAKEITKEYDWKNVVKRIKLIYEECL